MTTLKEKATRTKGNVRLAINKAPGHREYK